MKQKSLIHLGPGAPSLLLILVALTVAMLGMLAIIAGRNDAALSTRSAQVIEEVYALEARAQESLAKLDAVLASGNESDLPENMTREENVISWTETDGTRNLHCAVEVLPEGSDRRTRWVSHTLSSAIAEEAEEEEELFAW